MNIERIARVAHEANRALCESMGDFSQPKWEDAPHWQIASAMDGVKFHLDRHKAGLPVTPESSHENWLRQKRAEGWKFGPKKNPELKEHPCFKPYAELPVEQRLKDYVFSGIVKAFIDCESKEN